MNKDGQYTYEFHIIPQGKKESKENIEIVCIQDFEYAKACNQLMAVYPGAKVLRFYEE